MPCCRPTSDLHTQMFCGQCTYIPDTNDLSIGCDSCHYKAQNLANEALYRDYTKHLAVTCAVLLPTSYLCGLALIHWREHRPATSVNDDGSTSPSRSIQDSIDIFESMPALLKEGIHGKEGWTVFECSIALVTMISEEHVTKRCCVW